MGTFLLWIGLAFLLLIANERTGAYKQRPSSRFKVATYASTEPATRYDYRRDLMSILQGGPMQVEDFTALLKDVASKRDRVALGAHERQQLLRLVAAFTPVLSADTFSSCVWALGTLGCSVRDVPSVLTVAGAPPLADTRSGSSSSSSSSSGASPSVPRYKVMRKDPEPLLAILQRAAALAQGLSNLQVSLRLRRLLLLPMQLLYVVYILSYVYILCLS